MRAQVTLLLAALLAVVEFSGAAFERTGPCRASLQDLRSHYKYRVQQDQFDGPNKESVDIISDVILTCESSGTYGNKKAHIFDMQVRNTRASGAIFEKDAERRAMIAAAEGGRTSSRDKPVTNIDKAMSGWFKYVQTSDGAVVAVHHSKEEDASVVDFKKSICSAVQANFLKTPNRAEADTTSKHNARYTNEASVMDEEGTVKQRRVVDSKDVSDYASHIESDEVNFKSEDEIEYKQGVLQHSSGTKKISILPEVEGEKDDEADSLEAVTDTDRQKRDASKDNSYDPSKKMNHLEAEGKYSLTLAGQVRILRSTRDAVDHLQLPDAVESSLLAFINHTRVDIQIMKDIRSQLGNIQAALAALHENTQVRDTAHKLEQLLTLEAKYGPPPGHTPAIDDVLRYLKQLLHTTDENDIAMRSLIYFMISSEGSLRSQMALLAGLDAAVTEEERNSVVMYIAFVANPQPELVSKLEDLIGNDVHSTDSLLLAYGAIIDRASPHLQRRMIHFLLNRLPHAETNQASLIHHLHSLGNAKSSQVASSIADYLQHPDHHIQLVAISALRFVGNETLVQRALTDLLTQPDVSEEHLIAVVSSLQYGMEHAKNNRQPKPYNNELANTLVLAAMDHQNKELHSSIIKYLTAVDTPESRDLVTLMNSIEVEDAEEYSNETRFRRGTNWADYSNRDVYDLVEPLSVRLSDVRTYGYRKSYIWGKKVGVKDGNVKIAVGGFLGVSKAGGYKVFGHAVAEGHAFGRTARAVDFKMLRLKTSSQTRSILYAMVAGITLLNIDETQESSVCKTFERPLYEGKEYRLFSLRHSIFIYVGTLSFGVAGYAQMTGGAFLEFCENHGSISATAGLTPKLTLKVVASGYADIVLVVRGGIDVTGTFNYQVSPELSTLFCYKNYQMRVKNCAGIYHQWKDNTIRLDVYYRTRSIKWCSGWVSYPCGFTWSGKNPWRAASAEWELPGTNKAALWEVCDSNISC